ncbi:MAG: hypothetical protein IMZ58_01210 [Thermoplasmata archaeon]|nr:hypothetical protein [Thermoplasmata archaeon]
MPRKKQISVEHEVTRKLKLLVTNKIIVHKQNTKRDKEKAFDDETYKIKDSTWDDSSKEINEDVEDESDD